MCLLQALKTSNIVYFGHFLPVSGISCFYFIFKTPLDMEVVGLRLHVQIVVENQSVKPLHQEQVKESLVGMKHQQARWEVALLF